MASMIFLWFTLHIGLFDATATFEDGHNSSEVDCDSENYDQPVPEALYLDLGISGLAEMTPRRACLEYMCGLNNL
jgi:hypothetical protein